MVNFVSGTRKSTVSRYQRYQRFSLFQWCKITIPALMMDISPKKRSKIITLREHTTKTLQDIADECNVSLSSVKRILRLRKETGSVEVQRTGKCGRKKKTSTSEDRLLVRKSVANPKLSAVDLARDLKEGGKDVHVTTVRRRLLAAGLRARRPPKKQLLTAAMKKKRLNWARAHEDWTEKDWKRVIFSDESHFFVQGQKVQYVRKRANEKVRACHIKQTVKHPDKKMFWGCFSHRGLLDLVPVDGMLRSNEYIEILKTRLVPHYRKTNIFQQDLAPCHTAKIVKAFFQKSKVRVLDWPGNSPDVNPIENLWFIMKQLLSKLDCTTKAKVIANVNKIWKESEELKKHCATLVASMPNRVRQLIINKGGHISY